MKHLLSILLLILVLCSAQTETVQYFRTEDDFLSNVSINRRRLGWRSYLEVHFDENGNVLSKYYFKRKKKLLKFEHFSYDSTGEELILKEVFDPDSVLLQRYIFSRNEEMSEKYIKYVYGVDHVKDFGDRFTEMNFRDGILVASYRFFDVDAFLYGEMIMMYDDDGFLRQEDWVAMPEVKIVRRFLYNYDASTETTEIWEYDSTLAEVSHIWLGAEGKAPLFAVQFPTDSSFVNHTGISYSLLENLASGTVVWKWVGGAPDPLAPYQIELREEDMTRGRHDAVLFSEVSRLVDGAIYQLYFNGVGVSGYPAIEVLIQNVTYDVTAPSYTVDVRPALNIPSISFQVDEILSSAMVTWTWEGGETDSVGSHSVLLSGELCSEGEHQDVLLADSLELVEGALYRVSFSGEDPAGNRGKSVIVWSVHYDTTKPQFTLDQPSSDSYVNSNLVTYSLSEDLSSGRFVWHEFAEGDTTIRFIAELEGEELKQGSHRDLSLINAPILEEEGVYSLEIAGVDFAGNISDTVIVENVHYDGTAPQIAVLQPVSNWSVNSPHFSFFSDEDLSSARVTWMPLGKEWMSNELQTLALEPEYLVRGFHEVTDDSTLPSLQDGVRYELALVGYDRARNESNMVTIDSLLYDISPPEFSNAYPTDSSSINSPRVSFTLSESLSEGIIQWLGTGGALDPMSPYAVALEGEELSVGRHEDVVLAGGPVLHDGTVYQVTFFGTDAAGNRSDTLVVENVLYDTTAPRLSVNYPSSFSVVPDFRLNYSSSEELASATISWVRVGGKEDKLAPHFQSLVDDELSEGSHENVLISEMPTLVEGTIYSITLNGIDRAGNKAAPVLIDSVRYDLIHPQISLVFPQAYSHIRDRRISYNLSETLSLAFVLWEQVGGKSDPLSPHRVNLQNSELQSGEHNLIKPVDTPDLHDGSFYDVTFVGVDFAGNISDTLRVRHVVYDATPPRIDVSWPLANSAIPELTVSYRLSEDMATGTIIWRRTGGATDNNSPHVTNLVGEELKAGDHFQATLLNIPELVEGALYTLTFEGSDSAENVAPTVEIPAVLYDATAPVITDVFPPDSSSVKSNTVSYTLSETLKEGWIIWGRIAGAPDLESPHKVALEGDELFEGSHYQVQPINAPILQDGSIYTIRFVGIDAAQNVSDTVNVTNVLYDVTSPKIEVTEPVPYSFVADSRVTYHLSEKLAQGMVSWQWTGGTSDAQSPHVIHLAGAELSRGNHIETVFSSLAGLVEGAIYTVNFEGSDMAGNVAPMIQIPGVMFDATSPQITDVFPESNQSINSSRVSYALTETLREGTIIWTCVNGSRDPASPHITALEDDELNGGPHTLVELRNAPFLKDGAVYRIMFVGSDGAGNTSDTVTVDNILFDITAPRFEVLYPKPYTYISNSPLIFQLSEKVADVRVMWQWTGGAEDRNAPHVQLLRVEEPLAGERVEKTLKTPQDLVEGAQYTIVFEGKDKAGNEAEPVLVEGIVYDVTSPELTIGYPHSNDYVNSTEVSYTLSEPLERGEMIWMQIGGKDDPNSPHRVNLMGDELNVGEHPPNQPQEALTLYDGSIYRIGIVGVDFAGNVSDTVVIENVSYDITEPEFSVDYPTQDTFVRTSKVSYRLSEDITKGTITWKWVGGRKDEHSFHVQMLVSSELTEGEHVDLSLTDSPVLVDGATYSVTFAGTDHAGNVASFVQISGVTYDATPPVISEVFPRAGAFINSPQIAYSLSEDIESGEVRWIASERSHDPKSPHVVLLQESELDSGFHPLALLARSPDLQDGATYTLSLIGSDSAGNVSEIVAVENISFDITPPQFRVLFPTEDQYVSDRHVSYSLSEDIAEGAITWKWTGGNRDRLKTHEQHLVSSELTGGDHNDIILTNSPTLVDGARYTLVFDGTDFSGNQAEQIQITNVTFDPAPPQISEVLPKAGTFVNNAYVGYAVSESLAEGAVVWKRIGGAEDPNSPHRVKLVGDELTEGTHELRAVIDGPVLTDGSIYTLKVVGIDSAGNVSDTAIVSDVAFDVTPPRIAVSGPAPDSFVNSSAISYALSEPLSEGKVTWARIAGPDDPSAPHVVALLESELSPGEHMDKTLRNTPRLVDGVTYSMTFTAVDRAGNKGETTTIDSIVYDVTAPVIVVFSPQSGSYVNSPSLSYRVSEQLAEATVTWNPSDESQDTIVHTQALISDEMTGGDHFDMSLRQTVHLQDGSVYTLEFAGLDLAGNTAQTLTLEDIHYDISIPSYSLSFPAAGSAVNQPRVSFHLSERLKEAIMVWEWREGAKDPNAPHRVSLVGEELESGDHLGVILSNSPDLATGAHYNIRLQGTDFAGNDGTPIAVENVAFDTESPTISVTFPSAGSFVNHTRLSYNLSETLEEAFVSWAQVGGTIDVLSPHEHRLTPEEKSAGEHSEVVLMDPPPLQDGSIYDIAFEGKDAAGNVAKAVIIPGIVFDVSSPVFSNMLPMNSNHVNSAHVSYTISEKLLHGTFTWQRVGGSEDPDAPHITHLVGEELAAGVHSAGVLTEAPHLADGVDYRLIIEGEDRAGNPSEQIVIEDLTFDVTPPLIVADSPPPHSIVNNTIVSYSLTEPLREGTITWKRIEGTEDPDSPHVHALTSNQLSPVENRQIEIETSVSLVNGSVYSIELDGVDIAGNRASGMTIEAVTFDNEKPLISLEIPEGKKQINEPRISYSLNESLAEATVSWTQVSGEADPKSPHLVRLQDEELIAGLHAKALLANSPMLQDGSVYAVSLSGKDLAGNESEPATVVDIRFDRTPPEVTVDFPNFDSPINSPTLFYSVSEDLAQASAEWTWTGGNPDPGSPHIATFAETELLAGEHASIILANQQPLVDGATYRLTVTGADGAGNSFPEIQIGGIQYDITSARFSNVFPESKSRTNTEVISYTLSETLGKGSVTWLQTGGVADLNSPHVVELVGDELLSGAHSRIRLTNMHSLQSGAVYDLRLEGTDLAGNVSEVHEINQVTFDNTPPVFTISLPDSFSFVNQTLLSYHLSEDLAEGSVTWTRTDGKSDVSSPHVQALTASELQSGDHNAVELTQRPRLKDGAIYSIALHGVDLAGNEAKPVMIERIAYDVTSPEISLVAPEPHSVVEEKMISYKTTEDLVSATVLWARESGVDDPASPHVVSLSGEALKKGEHSDLPMPADESIQVGTLYTVSIQGTDLAGNKSKRSVVQSVDIIRDLSGKWTYQGVLMTVLWSFSGERDFLQGIVMGTQISDQERGTYKVDFSRKPFAMEITFESGIKRYCLLEFTGPNSMKIVTAQHRPKSWSDGDIMLFEYLESTLP